jgi:CHAT domain-containing protein
VTKTSFAWVHAALGYEALEQRVQALRCGLDQLAWRGDGAKECQKLLGTSGAVPGVGVALPFDLAKAYELYQVLFGQIESLLVNPDGTGKDLLVVPSGPLVKLPFQVLVTKAPGSGASYASADWLIKRNALTVLPSVTSLKALRDLARPSKATRPLLGYGNPLLDGNPASDAQVRRAKLARTKQSCPKALPEGQLTTSSIEPPGVLTAYFKRGEANVETLRRLAPLPETADELCEVAQLVGAAESDVKLGAAANELSIKTLSRDGLLASYAALHFATHGLLAAETATLAASLAEPALVLTPPTKASEDDNGLLTASEVTQLKIDADWVVLSACNTASGDKKENAEALSGLARAFFYAGARALLVSHWYVDSKAAVKITTGTFAEMKANPSIGRAQALRVAMLAAMADKTRPASWIAAAHPSVWAPFSVVGEGAR